LLESKLSTFMVPYHILNYCNESNLLQNSRIEVLDQDCSLKKHYRVTLNDHNSYIIVDASEATGVADPLIKIHNFMLLNNFSAPKILAYSQEKQLIVTEDFGDNSYKKILLEDPKREIELYMLAVKVLAYLGALRANIDLPIHNYISLNVFLIGAFENYYCTQADYVSSNYKQATEELKSIFNDLYNNISMQNTTIILRDYHIDNMMFLEKRDDYRKVGLLDIQDASIGHPAYDLVSLLEDARRDISPETVQKSKDYFFKLRPDIDVDEFNYSYKVLSMQRNLRILWLFAHLSKMPDKVRYKRFLPRVKNYIKNSITDPIFEKLLRWIDQYKIL